MLCSLATFKKSQEVIHAEFGPDLTTPLQPGQLLDPLLWSTLARSNHESQDVRKVVSAETITTSTILTPRRDVCHNLDDIDLNQLTTNVYDMKRVHKVSI